MDHIDFSEFFSTKAEANDFLRTLTSITDTIFQTDFHLETALAEKFGITVSDRLLSFMHENNINLQSRDEIKIFLQKMHDVISALPVLSMTVAFEPQERTLKALSEWFFINIKKQVLFDFTVDSKLVAGATLTYKGKFFDFSIRPVVERILKIYLSRLTASHKPPENMPPATVHQQQVAQPIHQRVQDISLGR